MLYARIDITKLWKTSMPLSSGKSIERNNLKMLSFILAIPKPNSLSSNLLPSLILDQPRFPDLVASGQVQTERPVQIKKK